MQLVKTKDGLFSPAFPSDWDEAKKIKVGEEVTATRSRNPEFHRKAMSLMRLGFDNQDTFNDFEIYRQVLIMKAGYVNWVKGKDGAEHPLPQSISFANMAQAEFEKLYYAVLEVISKETKTDSKDLENEISNYL